MRTIYLIAVAAALFSPAIAFSSTVTLSGTCGQAVISAPNGYLAFNLSNTGNGTASDLLVQPSGAGLRQNASVINTIPPDSRDSITFPVNSVNEPGSYAVNLGVTYDQQGTTFSTVFPCIVNIGTASASAVFEHVNYSNRTVFAKLMSESNSTLNLTATAVLPSGFYTPGSQRHMLLAPYGSANLSFNLTLPSHESATLPAAVELAYSLGGVHYAYLSTVLISLSGPTASGHGHGIGFVNAVFAIVIAVLSCLIVASIIVRRRGVRNE